MKSIPFQIFLEVAENIFNSNPEIIKKIENSLGLTFTDEKTKGGNVCLANSNEVRPEFKETFTSTDIQDYIYSTLQFETNENNSLEITTLIDNVKFWKLVQLGKELRIIHLLKTEPGNHCEILYIEEGNNIVSKIKFERIKENSMNEKLGNLYINENQYFSNVSEEAWNLRIQEQQIAKNWLENLKGLKLSFEDIIDCKKILIALFETDRILKEINKLCI